MNDISIVCRWSTIDTIDNIDCSINIIEYFIDPIDYSIDPIDYSIDPIDYSIDTVDYFTVIDIDIDKIRAVKSEYIRSRFIWQYYLCH